MGWFEVIGLFVALLLGVTMLFDWAQMSSEGVRYRGCRKLLGIFPRDHVPSRGYYGSNDPGYGEIINRAIDGINRKHGDVYVGCARCRQDFRIVQVHQHADK